VGIYGTFPAAVLAFFLFHPRKVYDPLALACIIGTSLQMTFINWKSIISDKTRVTEDRSEIGLSFPRFRSASC